MLRHLLETQQFDRDLLNSVFEIATSLERKREDSLHGKILASLFYEPSTRTRFSFESAMLRLGGGILTAENANEVSSAVKGETLEDSIRVMSQYADAIVIRHPEIGSADRAAAVSGVPIINASDGASQHPTQALLDLYTIRREIGEVDGIPLYEVELMPTNLPAPEAGILNVVSKQIVLSHPHRNDLGYPTKMISDPNGVRSRT